MLDVTVVEPEKDEKEWLKGLSKDEIIEHFMRAKVGYAMDSSVVFTSSQLRSR